MHRTRSHRGVCRRERRWKLSRRCSRNWDLTERKSLGRRVFCKSLQLRGGGWSVSVRTRERAHTRSSREPGKGKLTHLFRSQTRSTAFLPGTNAGLGSFSPSGSSALEFWLQNSICHRRPAARGAAFFALDGPHTGNSDTAGFEKERLLDSFRYLP